MSHGVAVRVSNEMSIECDVDAAELERSAGTEPM
jgi:hypothetical protein